MEAAQTSLVAAQETEVTRWSAYSHARISLDQVLGQTLDVNHVSVGQALNGARRAVESAACEQLFDRRHDRDPNFCLRLLQRFEERSLFSEPSVGRTFACDPNNRGPEADGR